MFDFASQSRRERIIQRNRTERLSELLDWNQLGQFYRQARRMALKFTHPEQFKRSSRGNVTPSLSVSIRKKQIFALLYFLYIVHSSLVDFVACALHIHRMLVFFCELRHWLFGYYSVPTVIY